MVLDRKTRSCGRVERAAHRQAGGWRHVRAPCHVLRAKACAVCKQDPMRSVATADVDAQESSWVNVVGTG